MATNATKPTRTRTARVIHYFYGSHRQLSLSLAAEAGLAVLALPLWIHFALGLVIHLLIHLISRRR